MAGVAWDESAIQEAIGAALHSLCELQVVWGEQALTMQRPRLVLSWVSETPENTVAELRPSDDGTDGDWDAVDQVRAPLQLSVYTDATQGSTGAVGLARKLRSRLGTPSGRAAIAASGFVVVDRSGVRNAAALVDPRIEGRAIFEITLAYAVATTENLSWVDEVETEDHLTL